MHRDKKTPPVGGGGRANQRRGQLFAVHILPQSGSCVKSLAASQRLPEQGSPSFRPATGGTAPLDAPNWRREIERRLDALETEAERLRQRNAALERRIVALESLQRGGGER